MTTGGAAHTIAAIVVGGLAVGLAVLPALFAAGMASAGAGRLAASLAGVAAVAGGVKLVAMAWGLAARFVSASGIWPVAVSME